MKKSILLLVTALLLTGLAGCSMTKNRYNHYGVVKYLENKYDDKFEYYETYGGTLFDSDSWKKFICTSEKYPGKHILVIYDVRACEKTRVFSCVLLLMVMIIVILHKKGYSSPYPIRMIL